MSSDTPTSAFSIVPGDKIKAALDAQNDFKRNAASELYDHARAMSLAIRDIVNAQRPAPSVEDGTLVSVPAALLSDLYGYLNRAYQVTFCEDEDEAKRLGGDMGLRKRIEALQAAARPSTSPVAQIQAQADRETAPMFDAINALKAATPPVEEHPPATASNPWCKLPNEAFDRLIHAAVDLDPIRFPELRAAALDACGVVLQHRDKAVVYRPTEDQQPAPPASAIPEAQLEEIVMNAGRGNWASPQATYQLVAEIRRLAAVVTQEDEKR